jgi:hypothetical protein
MTRTAADTAACDWSPSAARFRRVNFELCGARCDLRNLSLSLSLSLSLRDGHQLVDDPCVAFSPCGIQRNVGEATDGVTKNTDARRERSSS